MKIPKCPVHNIDMVVKIAKGGKYVGKYFYVCPMSNCKMHTRYYLNLEGETNLETRPELKDEVITSQNDLEKELKDKKAQEEAERIVALNIALEKSSNDRYIATEKILEDKKDPKDGYQKIDGVIYSYRSDRSGTSGPPKNDSLKIKAKEATVRHKSYRSY